MATEKYPAQTSKAPRAPAKAKRTVPTPAKAPKTRAKPTAPPKAAQDTHDATVRRMKDPWFSLACAGLKTRDARFAEPPQGPAGSTFPGFHGLAAGDVVTWSNTSLGFPRYCKVVVSGVEVTTLDQALARMTKPMYAKKTFPTVDAQHVVKVAAGLLKGKADKPVVIFDFKAAL